MSNKYKLTAYCYNRKGMLVSTGKNSYIKTHPLQKKYAAEVGQGAKQYLHAEIAAIIKAKGQEIHEIFIERKDERGRTRLAKPCPVCELAIKKAGIKIIVYTT